MPSDPYAVLRALVRAEAARRTPVPEPPSPPPSPLSPSPSPSREPVTEPHRSEPPCSEQAASRRARAASGEPEGD
ncbi:hypothetical protein [Streptomyces sp. NRRL S-340]|uniref:hypothetical protein n=1 Tax=Streptomyces sp. NRRL S-340 TaxID=1463901 RepID=UPI0005619599|nr:hypothetical protein [Streptomyces sp. NRRL S-340]